MFLDRARGERTREQRLTTSSRFFVLSMTTNHLLPLIITASLLKILFQQQPSPAFLAFSVPCRLLGVWLDMTAFGSDTRLAFFKSASTSFSFLDSSFHSRDTQWSWASSSLCSVVLILTSVRCLFRLFFFQCEHRTITVLFAAALTGRPAPHTPRSTSLGSQGRLMSTSSSYIRVLALFLVDLPSPSCIRLLADSTHPKRLLFL